MKKRFGGRWLALVLALVLLVSLTACGSGSQVANVADAEGSYGSLQWNYKHDSQTLTVTGTGAIPDAASSADVAWDAVRAGVVKLVISDGITAIGDHAFYYMPYLTSVSVPSTVTKIGNKAFAFCKSLASVSLPTSLTTVGASAFEGCSALKAVSLPASCISLGPRAFAYCRSMEHFFAFGSLASVERWTFKDCKALKEVVISSAVSESVIDGAAFEGVPEGYTIQKTSSVDGTSTVTVLYVNEQGETMEPSVSMTKAYGETHSFPVPAKEGYTPDRTKVDVVFELDDQTITVTYRSNAVETTPNEETTTAPTEPEPEGSSPWMIVGIVIMAVVLIGVAVLAVFIVRMDKKNGNKSQTVRKNGKNEKKK